MSIQYTVLLLYLGLESDSDVKRKQISVQHWMITWLLLFCLGLYLNGFERVVGGMVPGMILMAMSKATGESIGYGDGMSVLLCGMVLGLERACAMFLIALLLTTPYSLGKVIFKKAGKKEEIAFLPFLLAAYLLLLLFK